MQMQAYRLSRDAYSKTKDNYQTKLSLTSKIAGEWIFEINTIVFWLNFKLKQRDSHSQTHQDIEMPYMIQGYHHAEVVSLVISAKLGEFESGFLEGAECCQHVLVASQIGVASLVVMITKMDTIQWNQERFDFIVAKITQFAYKQFKQIHFIPVDALQGYNITQPLDKTICPWYSGPYLIDVLDTINIPRLNHDGPIRLPIMDTFQDLDNFYISGKLESGLILEGLECLIYPKKEPLILAKIYSLNNQRIRQVQAGVTIKIEIQGIQQSEIQKGMIICGIQQPPCLISAEFQARIRLNELPNHCRIISAGNECTMHLHSLIEEVQIMVEAVIDSNTKNPIKQNYLKSMQEGIVRISTKSPICLEKFDVIPSLGIFTLKSEDKIIGLGEIFKVRAFKHPL